MISLSDISGGAASVPLTGAGPDSDVFVHKGKFFAKIVRNAENFSNFIWGKHIHNVLLFD
jgi:hypothetical protein